MSDRIVNFNMNGKRGKYDIPFGILHVLNIYPQIRTQFKLDADAKITLFATHKNGIQHVFLPQESLDFFIEKSKGVIVTIYVKTPAPQRVLEQDSVAHTTRLRGELKPNEELHMANRGPSTHTVIEGKRHLLQVV